MAINNCSSYFDSVPKKKKDAARIPLRRKRKYRF
jgi:hypothetical protein